MNYWDYVNQYIPAETKTILDVGAGWGFLGMYVPIWRGYGEIAVDGIEIFPPYIERLKHLGYRNVYPGDILTILRRLQSASYDTIVCTEVLEHLPQSDVEPVIRECERVARLRVIFSSPNRFFQNDFAVWKGLEDNPRQQHRAFVPVQFMRRRGYSCTGSGRIFSVGMGLFHRVFARLFNGWVGYRDTEPK